MPDITQTTPPLTDAGSSIAIPLVDEQLSVAKREVVTGRVRVETRVDTIEQPVCARLTASHVEVERVAIGRVVDAAPAAREENGVTIIPVLEERLTVVRELVLVEEVRLRRVRTETQVDEVVTRRAMRAVVDREDS